MPAVCFGPGTVTHVWHAQPCDLTRPSSRLPPPPHPVPLRRHALAPPPARGTRRLPKFSVRYIARYNSVIFDELYGFRVFLGGRRPFPGGDRFTRHTCRQRRSGRSHDDPEPAQNAGRSSSPSIVGDPSEIRDRQCPTRSRSRRRGRALGAAPPRCPSLRETHPQSSTRLWRSGGSTSRRRSLQFRRRTCRHASHSARQRMTSLVRSAALRRWACWPR